MENVIYSCQKISILIPRDWSVLEWLEQLLDINLAKPTSNPSDSSQIIYWGINIPTLQAQGIYTGQNTISAVAN